MYTCIDIQYTVNSEEGPQGGRGGVELHLNINPHFLETSAESEEML